LITLPKGFEDGSLSPKGSIVLPFDFEVPSSWGLDVFASYQELLLQLLQLAFALSPREVILTLGRTTNITRDIFLKDSGSVSSRVHTCNASSKLMVQSNKAFGDGTELYTPPHLPAGIQEFLIYFWWIPSKFLVDS
ncbi:hypothetical protein BYT27DRAFT_7207016, partial [Phlegmacium glaucopus]